MQIRTSYKVERFIVLGFLLVILAGAFLLWFSNNLIDGLPLSPVDALFLSTSAVCVTGLSVVDISKDTGLASQLVMLSLIQVGGLGIMTGMMLLSLAVGRRVGIRGRLFFLGGLGVDGVQGAVKLFFTVIKYTFAVEGIGALLMLWGFLAEGESAARAAYLAVFHSVSSFCNAGFSPCAGGLQGYSLSLVVPGTAMLLIVLGGLGFPVAAEIAACVRERGRRLTAYSRLVISMTLGLVLGGAALFMISDWNGAFGGLPAWAKAWNALFASVTTRTAGYDTVAPAAFSGMGQALMVVLMLIGASPSSTGGGVKTTTLGVLAVAVWSELRGRAESNVFSRSISPSTERRSLAVLSVYLATMLAGAGLLSVTEELPFSALLFESASALATTGLSVGVTPELSAPGKLIVATLMFWGRVGLWTFLTTLIASDGGADVRYPETHIPIG